MELGYMLNRLCILVVSFFCINCSNMTLHEECTQDGARFGGYDRCMYELTEKDRRMRRGWGNLGRGLQQNNSQQQQGTSFGDYYLNSQQQNRNTSSSTSMNTVTCGVAPVLANPSCKPVCLNGSWQALCE